MTEKQLVSIIIPTFNRANLIAETLDSILAQTYQNWECIIVDDGSTDHTSKVVEQYLKKDNRFKYFHRPEDHLPGGNGARNYGYKISKGNFINWFDSDDLMLPEKLEYQVNALIKDNLDFVSCNGEFFGAVNEKITKTNPTVNSIVDYFFFGNTYITSSVMWNAEFLKHKYLFDESLKRGQEYDFHFRMIVQGAKLNVVKTSLFKLRRGHDSIETSSKSLTKLNSMLKVFEKCFKEAQKVDFEYKKLTLNYLSNRIIALNLNIMRSYGIHKRFSYLLKNIKHLSYFLKVKSHLNYYKTILLLFIYSFTKIGYNKILDKNYRKDAVIDKILLDLNKSQAD